jgi:hypothetical protein
VVLENGKTHDLAAASFGEACFDAMMVSDGNPCTLLMMRNAQWAKAWEIAEGNNPDFDSPDGEAA